MVSCKYIKLLSFFLNNNLVFIKITAHFKYKVYLGMPQTQAKPSFKTSNHFFSQYVYFYEVLFYHFGFVELA